MNLATAPASIISFEELLAPIPGADPSGRDLDALGLHGQIEEARREGDDTSRGIWESNKPPKQADWREVLFLGTAALTNETKDLQIAAWMTEALMKLHGFAGLRDGVRLTRELLRDFWATLYPKIEYPEGHVEDPNRPSGEGDVGWRASILENLSKRLAEIIKMAPLTNQSSGENFNYNQWEQAKLLLSGGKLSTEDRGELEELKTELERAKTATALSFYDALYALSGECEEGIKVLDGQCDELFKASGPSLSECKRAVADVRSLLEDWILERRPALPGAKTNGKPQPELPPDGRPPKNETSEVAGPIQSRQDAINRLKEVIVYFNDHEPQSPVPPLVKCAIEWAQLPLEKLVPKLISLGDARKQLGISEE